MSRIASISRKFDSGRRVLVGMRRIGVEEAAAVGAELLDRLLRGDGPQRQGLLLRRGALHDGAAGLVIHGIAGRIELWLLVGEGLEGGDVLVGAEVLHHALPHEQDRQHGRDRQQDVERRAGDVDPEVADGPGAVAGKAAAERDDDHDAGGSGEEVLHREPGHLREIAHRGLARVALPVGVGDETDGRVEGGVGADVREALRIQRQPSLQALQDIERERPEGVEQQQIRGVRLPAALVRRVDTAQAVNPALERRGGAQRPDGPAVEYLRHVHAERLHAHEQQQQEANDQRRRRRGHQNFSGLNSA